MVGRSGGLGLPVVRQKVCDLAVRLRGQPTHHIFEIRERIMTIELGRLDEAHGSSCALSCSERSGKEPIGAADGNRANPIFHVVVVYRDTTIIQVANQCVPGLERVVECSGNRRAVGCLAALQGEPSVAQHMMFVITKT